MRPSPGTCVQQVSQRSAQATNAVAGTVRARMSQKSRVKHCNGAVVGIRWATSHGGFVSRLSFAPRSFEKLPDNRPPLVHPCRHAQFEVHGGCTRYSQCHFWGLFHVLIVCACGDGRKGQKTCVPVFSKNPCYQTFESDCRLFSLAPFFKHINHN